MFLNANLVDQVFYNNTYNGKWKWSWHLEKKVASFCILGLKKIGKKKGFWKRKKLLMTTKNKGEEFKTKRHPLENLKKDKTKMSSEFLVSEQAGHIRL